METVHNTVVQNTSLLGTTFIARGVGGASLSGALFNEDISSTEGQLFPQQSMLVRE